MDQDLVSFVLRFVREAGEEQQARWRGVVKHVQSNTEANFGQFSEALLFMQGYVNDIAQASINEASRATEGPGVVNPFMETARLWGDYMPRYTKMMMDTMGETMGGASAQGMTEQMGQAMDATFATWGMATRTEQERTAASLETMTEQLAELTNKISELEEQISELKNNNKEIKE